MTTNAEKPDVPTAAADPQPQHQAPQLSHFADDTTIHGIKDVAIGRTPLRKFIWIVIVLTSIGAVVYEINQTVFGYLVRPKATQIKQLFQDTYPFPSVVFCPQTWMNGTKARDLNLTRQELMYALSFMPMLRVDATNNNLTTTRKKNATTLAAMAMLSTNLTELASRFDEKMNAFGFRHVFELFLEISLDSQEILDCSNCAVWPARKRVTEYGVCYQIELKDARRYYVEEFLFMPFFQYNQYTDPDSSYLPTYMAYNGGEKLHINMNENDFFCADMEQLSLNKSYLFKIAPSKQERIDDHGSCLSEEAFRARNVSQEMCYGDCEQQVYGVECWGFVHLGYFVGPHVYRPDNSTVPYWSALVHDADGSALDPTRWDRCQRESRVKYDRCAKKCLPQCREWVYETTVVSLNSRNLMTFTKEADLTVTFSYQVKSGTFVVEEKATYTWHTFLSNVGGQMSVWLGISILSVCQLVFFAFRWIEYRLQMRAEDAIHKKQMKNLRKEQQSQRHRVIRLIYSVSPYVEAGVAAIRRRSEAL